MVLYQPAAERCRARSQSQVGKSTRHRKFTSRTEIRKITGCLTAGVNRFRGRFNF